MKIAICADDKYISSNVSTRYARSNYFAIYDESKETLSFIVNNAKKESSGAGNMATKTLGNLGVDVLLAPNAGPNAFDMLEAFDIKVYQYTQNTSVGETLKNYHDGLLTKITHGDASKPHS